MLNNKVMLVLLSIFALLFIGCVENSFNKKQIEVMTARRSISSLASEPNNVVMMLPLTGEHAASSRAIRNGFLAAYYHDRKEHPNINIKIVDTNDKDILILYRKIVFDGAEVIVGPLTKKEVEVLLNIKLSIPVIALNTLDDYRNNFSPNLYQFGLLPQDEAWQVADKMLKVGHNRVAIIAPNNYWGNKVAQAFRKRYERSSGRVVAVLDYDLTMKLAEQICPFLARDAAKLCMPQKYNNMKAYVSPNDSMNRRQDINAIFLVATAVQARQIVPLLKFYYAGDLPIYAISSIYSGVIAPDLDQDINGVHFCDTPWVLQNSVNLNADLQAIYQQIRILWADDIIKYPRLYALGIDAYNLSSRLNEFVNSRKSAFESASGRLYLDRFNHIYRELSWAEFNNGIPVITLSVDDQVNIYD
ncbi:MAG: penicillin-binding protein activator [Coxiellaceae bacterium]|jgi:outer membrane PBP1 activator LpoA protein|nr:penicillin-binding protein activator [Coxiellaceae bacterium]